MRITPRLSCFPLPSSNRHGEAGINMYESSHDALKSVICSFESGYVAESAVLLTVIKIFTVHLHERNK